MTRTPGAGRGEGRPPTNEGRRPGRRPRPLGCLGGARPAPSSRLALIELGLSFDFEWGERAVLRVGKNYRRDPIPSVIGIIRYSAAHPIMWLWAFARKVRHETRAPRGAACSSPGLRVSSCQAVSWWDSRGCNGVRVLERGRRRVRRRMPGLGRRRAVVGRAGVVRADVAGGLPVPGHAVPAAAAAVRATPGRLHEEPSHIPADHESPT